MRYTHCVDPYALLELEPGASEDQIKKAWKRMARRHHPDLNPDDPDAAARFQRLREAYEALLAGPLQPMAIAQLAQMDEDWLEMVEWMIAVRQRAVLEDILPRFIGAYGTGAALNWALRQARDPAAAAEALPPKRPQWRLRRLRLSVMLVEEPGMWDLASYQKTPRGHIQLLLSAHDLWRRRGRSEDDLRAVVFSAVDHGLVRTLRIALKASWAPPTLEAAHQIDRRAALEDNIMRLVWLGAAVLAVIMATIMASA